MSSPRRPRPRQYRTVSEAAVRAVVVLFILAFLVAAASSWFAVRAVQGQIRSRASVVQLCRAGNESRAQQVQLWTHLIAISVPPPHQTPAQQAARQKLISDFLGFVRTDFAPRNCTASFKG